MRFDSSQRETGCKMAHCDDEVSVFAFICKLNSSAAQLFSAELRQTEAYREGVTAARLPGERTGRGGRFGPDAVSRAAPVSCACGDSPQPHCVRSIDST